VSEAKQAARVVVRFASERATTASGVVALEDYARELTRARAAEALLAEGDTGRLVGVVLEAPRVAADGAVRDDIEAFARDLAEHAGPGLGWS
jgi:hypothetical protein